MDNDDVLLDIEEYYDFDLLDLLDDEDAIFLADKTSYELEHDSECIKALERINNKKAQKLCFFSCLKVVIL